MSHNYQNFFPGHGSSMNVSNSMNTPPMDLLNDPFISPLFEAILPHGNDNQGRTTTIDSLLLPPINPGDQMATGSWLQSPLGNPGSFSYNHDHLSSNPTQSLMSLLLSNDPNTLNNELNFGWIGCSQTQNQIPIYTSASSMTLPLFPISDAPVPIRSEMNWEDGEVAPRTHLQSLPQTTSFGIRNQISNSRCNPFYLNPNQGSNYHPMARSSSPTWNQPAPPLLPQLRARENKPVYMCNTCRVQFPSAQAYGGHMSSHSKSKKAQDLWGPMASRFSLPMLKKVKLTPQTAEVLGKGKETISDALNVVEEENIPLEAPQKLEVTKEKEVPVENEKLVKENVGTLSELKASQSVDAMATVDPPTDEVET